MLYSDDSLELFKSELEYAYENVPFYKKHLREHNVALEDINDIEDVIKVPYTEKIHYRKNFPMGVFASGTNINEPGIVRSQSSGTTGERLITYEFGMLLMGRGMDCSSANPVVEEAFTRSPRKVCRYAAPNCSDVECANPNSTMEDRLLPDGTLVLPVYHDLLTTTDELVERALDEICEYQPDFYYVDPTHFAFLLRHAYRLGRKLPDAPVVTSYTGMSELARTQIQRAMPNSPLVELVSSSEMGWLAMECEKGHLHLNTDSFFMEVLNNNHHAALGEVGELYISSTDNGAIPHLRYKTGDAFRVVGDSCECEHHTPRVSMEGRISNFIIRNNSFAVSPREVSTAIGKPEWLDLYQLHQTNEFQCSLKLIVNKDVTDIECAQVIEPLGELLGSGIELSYEFVSYIATERSGKFQFSKTDVKLDNELFEA